MAKKRTALRGTAAEHKKKLETYAPKWINKAHGDIDAGRCGEAFERLTIAHDIDGANAVDFEGAGEKHPRLDDSADKSFVKKCLFSTPGHKRESGQGRLGRLAGAPADHARAAQNSAAGARGLYKEAVSDGAYHSCSDGYQKIVAASFLTGHAIQNSVWGGGDEMPELESTAKEAQKKFKKLCVKPDTAGSGLRGMKSRRRR